MKTAVVFVLFFEILIGGRIVAGDFAIQQNRYPRVREAMALKETKVRKIFKDAGIIYPPAEIFLRAFKARAESDFMLGRSTIELRAKDVSTDTFRRVHEYRVCYHSGVPGPKRVRGDGQVPEGFYHVERFNPQSNFLLSLGVNYPNQSDRIRGEKDRLGGDIFIHGNCVSIGCLAITDDKIRELYIIAVAARDQGQKEIPVHIFPATIRDSAKEFEKEGRRLRLWEFWSNLKEGYDIFERTRRPPKFRVDVKGRYIFSAHGARASD